MLIKRTHLGKNRTSIILDSALSTHPVFVETRAGTELHFISKSHHITIQLTSRETRTLRDALLPPTNPKELPR